MKLFATQVRELCERVRRPTIMRLIAGLALIAPAALLNQKDEHTKAPAPSQVLPALVVDVSAEALERAVELVEVTELIATPVVEKYAQEYRISKPLAAEIHQAAVAAGITPKVAFGLVRAESSFKPRVVSPVGAIGLTQLMPATARWLEPGITRRDLMQPGTNLRVGFKYLKSLINEYDGNTRLALTAFNRGPGTVNKILKRGRNPDNGYADKVLTGKSAKHVALMNKKFGSRAKRS